MKKELKNETAVTLIALVITITIFMVIVITTVKTMIRQKEIREKTVASEEKSELITKEEQLKLVYLTTDTIKAVKKDNTNAQTVELFKEQYELAEKKLQTLTLKDKISQMLLVTYTTDNIASDYGGILFFEADFKGKTEEQVKEMTKNLTNKSGIPMLTAVDEEGKTFYENGEAQGVIRVSSNEELTESNTYLNGKPFPNSKTLYVNGGFELIKTDTIEKSKFLYNLGLNLNLAPVVDICEEGDYMYHRAIGLDAKGTSTYAQVIIEASIEAKKAGHEISYCLKHFPGYGSNSDTHKGFSLDTRTFEEVKKDMASFERGIKCGAEAVLVSHNIVSSVDGENPASLSPKINLLLRNDLNFTGIIMTDALNMAALDDIEGNKYVKAVLAGNDILIVQDGKEALNDILEAVENGIISEEMIDTAVTRILAWKYYKNMFAI